MGNKILKRDIQKLLQGADIVINGNRPWDIQVHDDRFYNRLIAQGSLGLGESYMEGWWDCQQLDEFFYRVLRVQLYSKFRFSWPIAWSIIKAKFFNMQSKNRALIVGKKHYDLSHQLFNKMLDKNMVYSCAYWKNTSCLHEAQEAKLELICKKLQLQPGMKLLDIGCGWGGLAKYAAEKYQVQVVGITISQNQLELARQNCQGLPVELRFQDYRDVNEIFDRIVSVGQMEHVGYKNYQTYMKAVSRNLKDDGLFLLHSIGNSINTYSADPWIEKYIFPNGMIPSMKQLSESFEKYFVVEDWHNFGPHYDKTLLAWHANFNKHWDELKNDFDERFYRMWNYYLLSCAGGFRARNIQLWQIVLSKEGVIGGYESVR